MHIDQTTWNNVPKLWTGEDYREMAKNAVEAWKNACTPRQLELVRQKCRATREGLYNSRGTSETGELQFAFMLPQAVDSALAVATEDSNWMRNRPALFEAVVDEFQIGLMGVYGADIKNLGSQARRDFGCALGSGDVD